MNSLRITFPIPEFPQFAVYLDICVFRRGRAVSTFMAIDAPDPLPQRDIDRLSAMLLQRMEPATAPVE